MTKRVGYGIAWTRRYWEPGMFFDQMFCASSIKDAIEFKHPDSVMHIVSFDPYDISPESKRHDGDGYQHVRNATVVTGSFLTPAGLETLAHQLRIPDKTITELLGEENHATVGYADFVRKFTQDMYNSGFFVDKSEDGIHLHVGKYKDHERVNTPGIMYQETHVQVNKKWLHSADDTAAIAEQVKRILNNTAFE